MITSTPNRATAGKLLALVVLLAAIASLMLAAEPSYASTTFTVNSTEDHADANLSGDVCDTGYTVDGAGGQKVPECTLRAAINQANYTSGADAINFAIPGSGVKTIAPGSALPTITGPMSINGYSQPGASPNTKAVGSDAILKIQLSGANASDADGLVIGASNSTVKGLAINLWYKGIRIEGSAATGNRVVGNYLGTDASGTQDLGNDAAGVYVAGPNNTVGGATAAERNVISGNESVGVHVAYSGGNRILGNYVGTDATGTKDLGNYDQGVFIGSAPNCTVGGTQAGARNVISGNDDAGVLVFDAAGNRVLGNYLGTDATGTKDLGNYDVGVGVTRASSTTIGGATAGERNVISGNDSYGIDLFDSSGNKVAGNYIGTDKNGTASLGNTQDGVHITNARDNVVGGATAGERNLISGNRGSGVGIEGASATGNRVLSNSIFANGLLGIDLGDDGPTANDLGDTDTGANNLQNKPVLSSAKKGATGTTTVRGNLNSTPGKTFQVQFFSNPEGGDEGKMLLGSTTVPTDGSGNVSLTFSTTKAISLGQNITATATNTTTGDTSEFSAPRKVVAQ